MWWMSSFQKGEGKGNPSGKPDPNRPAAALPEAITIEMLETKDQHNTSVQAENQLAAAPIPKEGNLQVEREEAKHYDSKDEPNEADKIVSGYAMQIAMTLFTAAAAIVHVLDKAYWNQTESAHQQTTLELHRQYTRLASFVGIVIVAFLLLFYSLANAASTGSATRTKLMLMNAGTDIFLVYVITEIVITMPGSYWMPVLSYLSIGVVLITLIWHREKWFRKVCKWFRKVCKWFRKTPAGDTNDSSSTQPVTQGNKKEDRGATGIESTDDKLFRKAQYVMYGVYLIILICFVVAVTQGNKKEDRGAAGIGSADDKQLRDAKEDHYSIKKCIDVAHKYKDIIPSNKRVKAYNLLRSDSSLREMFLTMDEDEQKIWLSDL